jgi:cytochrome P450
MTHPEQFEQLRSDRDLVPGAVEEFLRYDSPVMVTIPAKTRAPVQVGEVTIPAGDVVVPVLSTANRDPHRFASPAELDLTRTNSPHTAFGHGIHHCLGAPLARLEARVAIGHLLDRFPKLRLAEPEEEPPRFPSLLVNGMSRLGVHLD